MSILKTIGFFVLAGPVALFEAFYGYYIFYRLLSGIPPKRYVVTRVDVWKREFKMYEKVYEVDNRNA